jgi:transposase
MEKELEINNRKLTPKEQENLRLKIIRVAKKNLKPNGIPDVKKVSEICECSESHVRGTWKKYLAGGIGGVKAVKMGRPQNSGKLTVAQQKKIQRIIVDKCPNQLKLKGFLWNRENVRKLIKQEFDVEITVQAISDYMKKWGYTPQRPVKKNYKQNPKAVQKWLEETYPKIAERAKEEGAEIQWGDETGCQNECNYVKGYAPIGQTPTLPYGDYKLRVNMISSITNKGKLRFMFFDGSMNAEVFIRFLERLIADASCKIFLIVDNLKTHHAILVKEWLHAHKSQIELFFLPSYSPELNPDEYLNGNLKREMAKEESAKTVGELQKHAQDIMTRFQSDEARLASFFQAKWVKYAA